jgi:predicted DNA-binding transcriptional regulator AlpA
MPHRRLFELIKQHQALMQELQELAVTMALDDRGPTRNGDEDRLVDVGVVADRLNKSRDWVYEHQKELPFRVKVVGRSVKFSAQGLEEYLRQQRQAR